MFVSRWPRWGGMLAVLILCLAPHVALAQDDDEEKPTERAYVLPYMLVAVLSGLAISGIMRPSGRKPADLSQDAQM